MKKITMTLLSLAFSFSINAQDLLLHTAEKVNIPEIPKALLFSQIDITNSGFSSTFSNIEDTGIYIADDFHLQTPSMLNVITAFGFANGYESPEDFYNTITGVSLYIYDNSGEDIPKGDPFQPGSGLLELVDLDPNGSAVNIGVNTISINLQEALGSSFELPAGDYWLVVAPSMDVEQIGTADNWNWFDTDEPFAGVNEAHVIAPELGVEEWLPFRNTNVSFSSTAFIIEGETVGDFANVQLIHNSPDPAASVVDVYLNGELAFDDFVFRTSTPFRFLPAGIPLEVDIAPGTSEDVSESLYNVGLTLQPDENYVVVADGVLDPSRFDDSVNEIDFGLQVYAGARQFSASAGNTDILVHHGSPDAPTVDVVNQEDDSILIDDISYAGYQGYLELPTDNYLIDVTTADNLTKVTGHLAYLNRLGLGGSAVSVLASGFLEPNSNQNGPEFGLWASLPDGGPLVELLEENTFPAPYCKPLGGTFSVEPITYVEFSNLSNRTSSQVNGVPALENLTDLIADVSAGETYDITLEGNTDSTEDQEYENRFTVFIDWNQDEDFTGDEVIEITQTISGSNGEDGTQAIQSIEVPADALSGPTRMRVKKYYSTRNSSNPCISPIFGHTQDYTVSVGALSNVDFNANDFTFYPNPVNDVLNISTTSTVDTIKVYNLLGQLVKKSTPKASNPQLNLSEINAGVYLVSLEVEGSVQTFRVMKK